MYSRGYLIIQVLKIHTDLILIILSLPHESFVANIVFLHELIAGINCAVALYSTLSTRSGVHGSSDSYGTLQQRSPIKKPTVSTLHLGSTAVSQTFSPPRTHKTLLFRSTNRDNLLYRTAFA